MQYLTHGEGNEIPKTVNFISMLGNEIDIQPTLYNINRNLIPISSQIDSENMYAIKIRSKEMSPTLKVGDTLWCRYDKKKLLEENSIVHYGYQGKCGVRRVKRDKESGIIVLVPDNLKNNDVLVITKDNHDKLEVSVVVGYSTMF